MRMPRIHIHLPSKAGKSISILVVILFVIVVATIIYKASHFKGVKTSKYGKYYDIPKPAIIKKYPVISVYPNYFNLSCLELATRTSLHGIFIVNIENTGAVKALISDIKWKIKDGDRTITPPSEWRKIIDKPESNEFYLPPHTGIQYIYGPEIGASGKNKILLSVEVKYKNPTDKSGVTHTAHYTGSLNYDKEKKVIYTRDKFITIDRSSGKK